MAARTARSILIRASSCRGRRTLASRQHVEWRVRVWTDAGESDWSAPGVVRDGPPRRSTTGSPTGSSRSSRSAPAGERPALVLRQRVRCSTRSRPTPGSTPPHTASTRRSSTATRRRPRAHPGLHQLRPHLHAQTYDVTDCSCAARTTGTSCSPTAGTAAARVPPGRRQLRRLARLPRPAARRRPRRRHRRRVAVVHRARSSPPTSWPVRPRTAGVAVGTAPGARRPRLPGSRSHRRRPTRRVAGAAARLGHPARRRPAGGRPRPEHQRLGPPRAISARPGPTLTLAHGEALDADGDVTQDHLELRLTTAARSTSEIDR